MRTIAIPVAAAAVLMSGAGVANAAEPAVSTPSTPSSCAEQTDAQAVLDQARSALADAQSRLGEAEAAVRSLNADKNAQQKIADNLGAQVRAASVDKIAHQQALPGLQAAFEQATVKRGTAAAALRDAKNAAAGAVDDIALRQGYIAAFKTKYAAANRRAEAAKDEIEKQQKLYRKAKDAGDTAAMEAAHAAAEAARASLATAEADMKHYGPASQATQQGHIDKDQALLDAVTAAQEAFDQASATRGAAAAAVRDAERAIAADTALGKKLHPQYQTALAEIESIKAAGQEAYKKVLALRETVAGLTADLADAQKALDAVVCPIIPANGTQSPGTGNGQTGHSVTTTPQAVTTVPVSQSAVRHVITTAGGGKTSRPVTYSQLAQTGALPGDELSWLLGGAAALLAAGGAAAVYGRHSKRD
ncbi:coiled-coil domain-containing protein [Amycolatopsis jiangsuensis]|uniref:Chromosome segregation ATPase n=1 Tax=Amycolatopsis jiangsuensis TaxID=1181879 RepID=A0A840J3Q6_9PSEU|nr:hypothetical protein [Amycolatopsis jiangsuensis]MBB4689716.1 chromosome segregation ATPase [Amycolatopsis jiangsuensis]